LAAQPTPDGPDNRVPDVLREAERQVTSAATIRPPWNVLVFPGGTEAGLEINRALRDCKEVELFGAGLTGVSSAEFRYKRYEMLPSITEEGAIDELNRVVKEHSIDFIYPAHDDVIVALARASEKLAAPVISSPSRTCEITRLKSATYKLFDGFVPVPKVLELKDVHKFPVFVKPDRGQGSQGAQIVRNIETLHHVMRERDGLLITEYLPGDEFTIDCFSSRRHGLLTACARQRVVARSGISMNSRLDNDPVFSSTASKISEILTFTGAWFFQMKRDSEGQLRLLEIAPRIAGTMALNRVRGINFPLLSLYDAAGYDLSVSPLHVDIEIGRSLDNHYRMNLVYSSVYVDLDDTLLLRGEVNTRLIRFLFQCVNRGIPIHLITRHKENLKDTLAKFRLSTLFDHVHHLTQDEKKSSYISETDAIFIDDSHRERSLVFADCGIPVFDPSSIECLLDDRA
jgi:hypothetical protein